MKMNCGSTLLQVNTLAIQQCLHNNIGFNEHVQKVINALQEVVHGSVSMMRMRQALCDIASLMIG